ncbi:nitroreductase family protein [Kingella kingae]|uniref:nitroreductase family protein n=2 Tax=Kingella kingae TaxID=504 RepID=UPI000416083F|nr:nitroreductase family protein [Kingella kingae]MDK4530032.1 nitroreductase family protein [Kingella kingae]MDK4538775.1 nitroreductase family protein [Kingella kingae]MDK4545172.1 nitroreductase family protein [Kingella kingae]MDK4545949.1 nitroreductase family protein [Kingella kingae]MDK4567199.1 nitroreductase family protein [Kingella kingae]
MSVQVLQQIAETRRSVYALNKDLPIAASEVAQIVEHAIKHTPSSFNSQSTRAVVLFGAEHEKLWDIAINELRKIVPAENFQPTEDKLNMFKAAAGSVLFFEDQKVVKGLQEQFVAYAANFPVWADHADAMTQYAIWTTLAAAGVGANLQHYNPVIDAEVAKTWNIPADWTLRAQLVFGGIAAPAGEKAFNPIEERFQVHGL